MNEFNLGYMGSNITPEEARKYGTLEQVQNTFDYLEIEAAETATKREELLEEQIYFANELIGTLESVLDSTTRLKEFKTSFKEILENSQFDKR